MIGSTLLLIRSLIQNGAIPKPATQAMRQITATRSSQVASVSFRYLLLPLGYIRDGMYHHFGKNLQRPSFQQQNHLVPEVPN